MASFTNLSNPADSSRFPLFSQYDTQILAWTQQDGLYFSYLNQGTVTNLSENAFRPHDFSPGNQYLSSEKKIFDLVSKNPLPIVLNGKSQFFDENTILFYEKTSHQVYLSNLSGTNQEVLIGPLLREFPFAAESSQRYVAYFSNEPSNNRLFILNLDTREIEIERDFPFSESSSVACLFWPDVLLINKEP